MAINYPASLDTLTNPAAGDALNSPSHATQHINSNDIIEALEAKVGVDSSAVLTSLDFLTKAFPEGTLINGRIVPSVASNNLTVALKGMDGNDPSAANPLYVRIGNTVRSITAALSVTKNAGTNWCNSGAAENATNERDYFVYLGYNATDGVVIGFSRIPYACEYSDFSTTTTNARYCAISTISNAANGDDYTVIGRFAATLSATANFYWSVPTFSNINLIQKPIYQTRSLVYTPVARTTEFDNGTGSTYPTIGYSRYIINGNRLMGALEFTNAVKNGAGDYIGITNTMPMAPSAAISLNLNVGNVSIDVAGYKSGLLVCVPGTTTFYAIWNNSLADNLTMTNFSLYYGYEIN